MYSSNFTPLIYTPLILTPFNATVLKWNRSMGGVAYP